MNKDMDVGFNDLIPSIYPANMTLHWTGIPLTLHPRQ
jgi:hypothetical protein